MSERLDALAAAAAEWCLGQSEEVLLAFVGAGVFMNDGLSEEVALARLQEELRSAGLSAEQVEVAFSLQNDAAAWLRAKQGPSAKLIEQLGDLFPEIRVLDLVDAVEAADNQVQKLVGQLQTLAEAAGIETDEITEILGQIEFDETWDPSQ